MNSLKERILRLQETSESLEPTKDQRDSYIESVKGFAHKFISSLNDVETFNSKVVNKDALSLSNSKRTLDEIIKTFNQEVAEKGMKPASGGHLGYIPGGGIYAASLGDFLADITNEYTGMYYASPGGVTIENELIDWMKELFEFPKSSVGNLTSGGSIANLIALTAARDKHGIKNAVIEKSVIYTSPQIHHCVHKALRIIGLEDVQIRYVELDENSRIVPEDLERKIEADKTKGLNPFVIIASAGTTDTGAIDPLEEIGEISKKNGLWYHVDGAYGGFFMLVDKIRHKLKGIEMADSLVVDPHKGLFLPYGLGAVLVKDKQAVYHSNHYRANYMQDAIKDDFPVNPADVSPELTKHFRGLRLWLPLQLHGVKPFKACLEEKLLLTNYFREGLKNIGFELGPEPDLSVSYFWYPSKEVDQNTFNERLMQAIHSDGEIFLSSTLVNGKFVIRMAILSFRTKLETIDRAVAMINRIRKEVENEFKA